MDKNEIKTKYARINRYDLVDEINDDSLYIIGNGFDLAHGVKSSYFDFEKTVGKRSFLRHSLEAYIPMEKKVIWGNFEDSLAHIDRGIVLYGLDTFLDLWDLPEPDDEDFTYADFYCCIDETLAPMDELVYELPKRFKRWVQALKPASQNKIIDEIINPKAKYINFNYTEFLESIYNVPNKNIIYIHGDRRNKKSQLVLGHGRDSEEMFEEWYRQNKKRKVRSNDIVSLAYLYDEEKDGFRLWKSASRYYAAQYAVQRIEEYYDNSAKKTTDILEKYQSYFNSFKEVSTIVVLGHSLSFVDYPYFSKILQSHSEKSVINWYISYYDDNDILRINQFSNEMNIPDNQIKIFRICD